jgi:cellulose synthase/poly-beta-1,6-N-acetylglucosamine synthase-like glycosyltransferase
VNKEVERYADWYLGAFVFGYIAFWVSVTVLAYVYFGYPAMARAFAALWGRRIVSAETLPTITVVVTAYNEEKGIARKLQNLLALDYPRSLVNIVVASDASADGTDRIVKSFSDRGIALLRVEGRVGKTACQNAACAQATGDIVIFTDATTEIDAVALKMLVRSFADSSVACVAARLVYRAVGQDATSVGGTTYWNYESRLRMAESELGSLIGVSGCFYAVRRESYRPIPPGLISDFVVSMYIRDQGLRTVLEPAAICYEETLDRAGQELAMRVRVTLRSLVALWAERRFLNPLRYGVFAWQLCSHKVLRYLSPIFWIVALVSNASLLQSHVIYQIAFCGQVAVLASGALGFILQSRHQKLGAFSIPYYFLLTNVASLIATWRFIKGEKMVTWQPVR